MLFFIFNLPKIFTLLKYSTSTCIVRQLAVRPARVQIGSEPQEGFPTELIGNGEMERNLSEWRRMIVCD
jgi:hypothetical protein